jgi:hypothetical protein
MLLQTAQQGRTGDGQRQKKRLLFEQGKTRPVPGIDRAGTLKTHFFEPKRSLTACSLFSSHHS